MKTVLITGGLGFIGYHLSCKLSELQDYRVIIVDAIKEPLFYIPHRSLELEERKRNLLHKNIEIIKADCNDEATMEAVIQRYKPETIFHLASLAIAGIANYNPQLAKNDIFDATFSLLNVLRKMSYKPEKLIYMSSSMVYGNFPKNEKGEIIAASENQLCKPICVYGALKLSCEHLLSVWKNLIGLPYSIVRTTAVYGPTDFNMRVVETFLRNALNNKPLLMDNGGEHSLDFTYIDDLTEGLLLLMNQKEHNGEVFNLSYGKAVKIKELAQLVQNLVPSAKIEITSQKPFRPNRGALDISKAQKLLNYQPKYSIEKGLAEYYNYLKEQYQQ